MLLAGEPGPWAPVIELGRGWRLLERLAAALVLGTTTRLFVLRTATDLTRVPGDDAAGVAADVTAEP